MLICRAARPSQHGEDGDLAACRAEADPGCTTGRAARKAVAETWPFQNLNPATPRTARGGRCGENGASAAPLADRA